MHSDSSQLLKLERQHNVTILQVCDLMLNAARRLPSCCLRLYVRDDLIHASPCAVTSRDSRVTHFPLLKVRNCNSNCNKFRCRLVHRACSHLERCDDVCARASHALYGILLVDAVHLHDSALAVVVKTNVHKFLSLERDDNLAFGRR